jgi:hypothetical protein
VVSRRNRMHVLDLAKSLKLGRRLFLLAGFRFGLNIFRICGSLPITPGTRYLVRLLLTHSFDLWDLNTWRAELHTGSFGNLMLV